MNVEKSGEFQAWEAAKQKQSQVQSQIAELRMKEDALAAQLRSIATDPQDLTGRASAFLDGGIEAINHREHLAEQLEKLREQNRRKGGRDPESKCRQSAK